MRDLVKVMLSRAREPLHAITAVLLLTALLASGHSQGTLPTSSQVTQIAYETADDVQNGDLLETYTDDAYVRSEPKWKSKHFLHLARLPKWSPDGRKVAFLTVCQGGSFYVYTDWIECVQVADQDGSHRILLTHYPTKISGQLMNAVNFAWSSTGNEIAYVEEDFTRTSPHHWTTISTVGTDGSGPKEIQRLPCLVIDPTLDWSPDGKKLAFTGCSGVVGNTATDSPTISVVDVVSGEIRVVAEGIGPLWSPDGKMLLFRRAGLRIVNSDGTREREVLQGEAASYGLTWLHGGGDIGFASTRDNTHSSEIFRVNVDGTGLQKVASGARVGLSFSSPVFSPDGQQLIVSADTCLYCSSQNLILPKSFEKRYRHPAPRVLLIDLSTGKQGPLVNGFHPSVMWGHH